MNNESLLRIPLYVQVREKLREDLLAVKPGTMIPPEAQLEIRFSVSRITIRKAIDDLVSEGLLVRRQGRGTYRDIPKLVHELNTITSWTQQLRTLGYSPKTAELEVMEVSAPKQVERMLQLQAGEKVIQVRRIRLADEEPITLMVNYIPSRLVPGFLDSSFDNESLYEFLKTRFGLVPLEAIDTVETRPATESEAQRLRIEPWAPVLVVTRVSYLESKVPFEMAEAVSCGNRYEYRVKLFGPVKA
ncbi:MAG: GntR family transcriptional regulator [Terracidiphilus sp.]|nr:GntR family transcriptional regulator [Terracidiphilus sp.]